MKRFKNILFNSIGGKDDYAALDRANRLAQSNRARITLLRSIDELPKAASYFLPEERVTELMDAAHSKARLELEKLATKLEPSLKTECKVAVGKPFMNIIRLVNQKGYDLVIKPRQKTKPRSLGPTDHHLLRKCPCPIWIIKPSQRKPFGKIMIAIDPDPSEGERLKLHTELLKLGMSLAQKEASKVEVIHTWQLDGESILRGPRFRISSEELNVLIEKVESTHRKWLDSLLKPYPGLGIKVTLVRGDAAPTLAAMIEKSKPDIVVMGTLARTGLPGLFIGNTAEHVLGEINCSLLAMKPEGFQTPVS